MTMDAEKLRTCWLIYLCSHSCKEETVVDASKGAKPVKSSRCKAFVGSPAVQHMSSDGNEDSVPSTPRIENFLQQNLKLRVFTYNELRSATRNFRPDSALGEGGFGTVYKGWIDEVGPTSAKVTSSVTVAVKALNQEGSQGHREWLTEVNYLGQLLHPNLVKLIGYSCENEHRLLVYEFMPRGSLENHLFRKAALPLSWAIRMKIAVGAAKGLAFLHGAEKSVIYRDFKTSNILLDLDYTAKLSDFGLAKDGPEGDQTHVSTRVMGTYGYAAPEYVMTGHLTWRSDVYSFGVVLLELLTGRRSMDKTRPHGQHNLVEWARPYLRDKRKLLQIVDPRLEGMYSVKGAQKAASLAFHCLSFTPKTRPLMTDVVQTLEPLQNMRDMASASYMFVGGMGTAESEAQKQEYYKRTRAKSPVPAVSELHSPNAP
ncbi:hypothetical protein L7F22_021943 [Adiantum nelumboides]|nr:hypothetical protein [Adiantum nelumboides]